MAFSRLAWYWRKKSCCNVSSITSNAIPSRSSGSFFAISNQASYAQALGSARIAISLVPGVTKVKDLVICNRSYLAFTKSPTLETSHITTRLESRSASKSKYNNKLLQSDSFTVRSVAYLDSADNLVHSGSFHFTALYAPPFFLIIADPSKVVTIRF